MVDNGLTVVKNKPVKVKVSAAGDSEIHIDEEVELSKLVYSSSWLSVETDIVFGLQVIFHIKHLDILLTKTTGLTKYAHGLIGRWICISKTSSFIKRFLKF